VPRDRAGAFHTQVFERYSRYEPEVAEALTDMFGSFTSTKTSGQSGGKTAGSGSQRQCRQPAQPGADRAI
jgi:putative transposase